MKELNLYVVSAEYINYLRQYCDMIYDNKDDEATGTSRKYVGIILNLSNYHYYIPLSSPKKADYYYVDGERKIRKSIIPIVRIVVPGKSGKKELKGSLRLSNMIPVPMSEVQLLNINEIKDMKYRKLIEKELLFIRKNANLIKKNAKLLYRQKLTNNLSAKGYLKATLDFKEVEKLCELYMKNSL